MKISHSKPRDITGVDPDRETVPLPHVSVRGTLVQVTRRIPYFKRDQKSLSGGYEKNNCVTVEMDYEIIKRYFFMNNLLTKKSKCTILK